MSRVDTIDLDEARALGDWFAATKDPLGVDESEVANFGPTSLAAQLGSSTRWRDVEQEEVVEKTTNIFTMYIFDPAFTFLYIFIYFYTYTSIFHFFSKWTKLHPTHTTQTPSIISHI